MAFAVASLLAAGTTVVGMASAASVATSVAPADTGVVPSPPAGPVIGGLAVGTMAAGAVAPVVSAMSSSAGPAAADLVSVALSAASGAKTAALPPPPPPSLVIEVNLTSQRMTVREHGAVKYTWPVSSARFGYRTPTGTFKPQWMARMWYSRQYDMSPMPHSIFFSGGAAIHATSATGMLGRPASHGCVRLAPGNAAALYKLVNRHGTARTKIVVHGTPTHKPAVVARRKAPPLNYSQRRQRYTTFALGYGAPYYVGNAAKRPYPARVRRTGAAAYSAYR